MSPKILSKVPSKTLSQIKNCKQPNSLNTLQLEINYLVYNSTNQFKNRNSVCAFVTRSSIQGTFCVDIVLEFFVLDKVEVVTWRRKWSNYVNQTN